MNIISFIRQKIIEALKTSLTKYFVLIINTIFNRRTSKCENLDLCSTDGGLKENKANNLCYNEVENEYKDSSYERLDNIVFSYLAFIVLLFLTYLICKHFFINFSRI